MKTDKEKISFPIIVLLVTAVVVIAALLFMRVRLQIGEVELGLGCNKCVKLNQATFSQSKKYTLIVKKSEDSYDIQIIPVSSLKGTADYKAITEVGYFLTNSQTNIMWDDSKDIVWVYSRERGVFQYKIVNKEWVRTFAITFNDVQICPPYEFIIAADAVKESFPSCYNK